MNYEKLYFDYINYIKSLNRKHYKKYDKRYVYYEKHHIIPKSLGGTDDLNNLVLLTAREHYLAHYMLTKIYPCYSMIAAFLLICNTTKYKKDRIKTSKQYENVRKKWSKELTELNEVRYKNGKMNNFLYNRKGKSSWNKNKLCPIICITTGKIYNSIQEVANELHVSINLIRQGCRNKTKIRGNLYEYIEPIIHRKNIKVICVETGETFDSPGEAAKVLGFSYSHMLRLLKNNKYKDKQGNHWKRHIDYLNEEK